MNQIKTYKNEVHEKPALLFLAWLTVTCGDTEEVHKLWCINEGVEQEDMLTVRVAGNVEQLGKKHTADAYCEHLEERGGGERREERGERRVEGEDSPKWPVGNNAAVKKGIMGQTPLPLLA